MSDCDTQPTECAGFIDWTWLTKPKHAVDMMCSVVYIEDDTGAFTIIEGIPSIGFGAGMMVYMKAEAYGILDQLMC